jgi:hypothetical protein
MMDHLCGLVFRVPGYRSKSPVRFPALPDFQRGSGSLSLVTTTEELLERKSRYSGLEIQDTAVGISHADHVAPSIRKSWH